MSLLGEVEPVGRFQASGFSPGGLRGRGTTRRPGGQGLAAVRATPREGSSPASYRAREGRYPTTEACLLERCLPDDGRLHEEAGLRLVLEACDRLEAQASWREDETAIVP